VPLKSWAAGVEGETVKRIAVIALALTALAGAPSAEAVTVPAVPAVPAVPVADAAATPSAGERRCRTVARRRLARVRANVAVGKRPAARKRVRHKLRRCLRRARAPVDGPSHPGDTPPPGPGTPPPPPPPLSRFLGVTASDSDGFRLTLSRPVVGAGLVTFELRNNDSGPHDLVVRPSAGGDEIGRLDEVEPGGVRRKGIELAKGDWYLFCSLEGHEAAGMHATLRAE
jgi:hypothetical protein